LLIRYEQVAVICLTPARAETGFALFYGEIMLGGADWAFEGLSLFCGLTERKEEGVITL